MAVAVPDSVKLGVAVLVKVDEVVNVGVPEDVSVEVDVI